MVTKSDRGQVVDDEDQMPERELEPQSEADSSPVPVTPMREFIDKFTHLERLQLRSNQPRVRLSTISSPEANVQALSNESLATTSDRVTSSSNPASASKKTTNNNNSSSRDAAHAAKLKQLESEAAQHDLKHKIALRENEAERMAFEREIYQKQITLLDLKIRKANLEVDQLQRGGNCY